MLTPVTPSVTSPSTRELYNDMIAYLATLPHLPSLKVTGEFKASEHELLVLI